MHAFFNVTSSFFILNAYIFLVIYMNYEVKEKKFYEVSNIKKIENYQAVLKHLETTFDLEKYLLEIDFFYVDLNDLNQVVKYSLPIDFNTTMTEQLEAKLLSVKVSEEENKGINIMFELEVEVSEIADEPMDIEVDKQEIKETYQQELEEKFCEREEVVTENPVNVMVDVSSNENDDFLKLNTTYIKYKVINLDEISLDKISVKYNIPMDKLYNLKTSKNKLIVYDKE